MRNDARPIGEDSPASPIGGDHNPLERDRPGERKDPKPEHIKSPGGPNGWAETTHDNQPQQSDDAPAS